MHLNDDYYKFHFFLIITFLLVYINISCTTRKEPEVLRYTVTGEKISRDSLKQQVNFPGYQLKASYYDMILSSNGQFNVTERGGGSFKTRIFKDTTLSIKKVEYSIYGKDLIIIFEIRKGREEWSEVARINFEKRRVEWRIPFGSFNLSTALIQGEYLYGSTLGFVGKVNLKKGEIEWKKEDLWEKYKVNNFEKIVLYKDTLALVGKVYKMNGKKMKGNTVTFKYNKHNGREISER